MFTTPICPGDPVLLGIDEFAISGKVANGVPAGIPSIPKRTQSVRGDTVVFPVPFPGDQKQSLMDWPWVEPVMSV